MNIAIVGATGNVGRKLLEVLEKKQFPIDELFLIVQSCAVSTDDSMESASHPTSAFF